MESKAKELLERLNSTYVNLHKKFEDLFWIVRMGDFSYTDDMNKAESERDAFRSDVNNLEQVKEILGDDITDDTRSRLTIWKDFFELYQVPEELVPLREEIAELQSKMENALATQEEGYIDPESGEFVKASKMKMRTMMRTNSDESIRKACFDALEKMAVAIVDDYVKTVELRNKYARGLGFEDFYAYSVHINEGMKKKEIFDLFDKIYEETKDAFLEIRDLEKDQPGLRKPYNFGYYMTGDFIKEEDPYNNFDDALMRWGKSFAGLGIDFKGATLQLDLLDRVGKYNNGFCHYPNIVNFVGGKRNPGSANFTCNVVYGQVGSGVEGMRTLFHEGGHAADRTNSEQTEACLNTEWAPASVAWAETHSMFLESISGSIEWLDRYSKDKEGNPYPFGLFEKKARKLRVLAPLGLHSIMMVSEFEKRIYEEEGLTSDKVMQIARDMHKKYNDQSEDSLWILTVPHIYSWDSSAYYHAYGLATLALTQWRKYFYDKYGYIVDNKEVGKEMTKVWELGSLKKFNEFVKLATGRELSADAFIEEATMEMDEYLSRARDRIEKLESVPEHDGAVEFNASVKMVHGKEVIADNSLSFEKMAEDYNNWLHTQA